MTMKRKMLRRNERNHPSLNLLAKRQRWRDFRPGRRYLVFYIFVFLKRSPQVFLNPACLSSHHHSALVTTMTRGFSFQPRFQMGRASGRPAKTIHS